MMDSESGVIASAILSAFVSDTLANSSGEPANLVDVLADGVRAIRQATESLGTGDAATQMGALEFVGKSIAGAGDSIGVGLVAVAEAIDGLAETIRRKP